MNYNYPSAPFQAPQQQVNYGGYRPMPQQYQPWTPPTQTQQVRPVSSVEEVKACPIDFDGSIFYFTDVANKRIYTKQINLDGTATINLYELKTDQPASVPQYVTKQEFENVITNLYNTFTPLLKTEEVAQQPTAQPIVQQQKPTFEF